MYAPGGGSDETLQTLSYKITAIPSFITLLNSTTTVAANTTLTAAEFAAFTYKTVADANGSAAFTFDVIDSGSGTSPNSNTLSAQSVTITVNAVDDVPVVTTAGQVNAVIDKARSWSARMPSAPMAGLELLVQRGLLDANSRAMARKGVTQLEQLRLKLLNKLEALLLQAGDGGNQRLLLSGQSLADELAAVEDLEIRLNTLLEQQDKDPQASQSRF